MKIIITIILIFFIFQSKIEASERRDTVASYMWCECHTFFYTIGGGRFIQHSGFIKFSSDTININDYEKGIYQVQSFGLWQYGTDFKFSNDTLYYDSLKIKLVDNDNFYYSAVDSTNKSIVEKSYNQFWKYTLFKVTYQSRFLGRHEVNIPKLYNKYKFLNKSSYFKKEIPIYAMKIISIEPILVLPSN